MGDLLRLKNLEIQGASNPVEIERNVEKALDSAGVFESIRGVNQKIKQAMREEMKCRGLTDDDIRNVLHIDND